MSWIHDLQNAQGAEEINLRSATAAYLRSDRQGTPYKGRVQSNGRAAQKARSAARQESWVSSELIRGFDPATIATPACGQRERAPSPCSESSSSSITRMAPTYLEARMLRIGAALPAVPAFTQVEAARAVSAGRCSPPPPSLIATAPPVLSEPEDAQLEVQRASWPGGAEGDASRAVGSRTPSPQLNWLMQTEGRVEAASKAAGEAGPTAAPAASSPKPLPDVVQKQVQRRQRHSIRTVPSKAARVLGRRGGSDAGPKTLGLQWADLGPIRPAVGTELHNGKLASALEYRSEFMPDEFEAFGVHGLRADCFIRVGSTYYAPEDPALGLSWMPCRPAWRPPIASRGGGSGVSPRGPEDTLTGNLGRLSTALRSRLEFDVSADPECGLRPFRLQVLGLFPFPRPQPIPYAFDRSTCRYQAHALAQLRPLADPSSSIPSAVAGPAQGLVRTRAAGRGHRHLPAALRRPHARAAQASGGAASASLRARAPADAGALRPRALCPPQRPARRAWKAALRAAGDAAPLPRPLHPLLDAPARHVPLKASAPALKTLDVLQCTPVHALAPPSFATPVTTSARVALSPSCLTPASLVAGTGGCRHPRCSSQSRAPRRRSTSLRLRTGSPPSAQCCSARRTRPLRGSSHRASTKVSGSSPRPSHGRLCNGSSPCIQLCCSWRGRAQPPRHRPRCHPPCAGVVRIVGELKSGRPLIGVAALRSIRGKEDLLSSRGTTPIVYKGRSSSSAGSGAASTASAAKSTALNAGHSHFVLFDEEERAASKAVGGREVQRDNPDHDVVDEARVGLTAAVARAKGVPSLLLVVQGGVSTLTLVRTTAEAFDPIVLLVESGGAARAIFE